MSNFACYRFYVKNGSHEPPVYKIHAAECVDFVIANMGKYPEIRVCNSEDEIVIHAVDGKIVYPVPFTDVN